MALKSSSPSLDVGKLRDEIRAKYGEVATRPDKEFHFHHGRYAATLLEYPDELLDNLPGSLIESFAGTGNPFSLGPINEGERVLDVGCGAGFDALIAAMKVGPGGHVIGVDMTPDMLVKARRNAASQWIRNVEFREGLAEDLPVEDGSIDVVISNGVINLCPDKEAVYRELYRVLKPGGRLMVADITVQKAQSEEVKADIDLWTG
jgi:arsenite methyltransferase